MAYNYLKVIRESSDEKLITANTILNLKYSQEYQIKKINELFKFPKDLKAGYILLFIMEEAFKRGLINNLNGLVGFIKIENNEKIN